MTSTISNPETPPIAELYGSLEKIAEVGTWKFVFRNQRLTWSAGVYELLGLEKWIEPPSHDLFGRYTHPADQISVDNLAVYLGTVRSIDREFRVMLPDGRIRWLAHKAEVFSNEKGECAFAVGILQNITRLKEALTARDYAEKRLRDVSKATASFTWTIDSSGEYKPSQSWTALTGQTAEQSSHLGWLNVIYEDDREKTKAAWIEAIKNKAVYSAKYRLRCLDGKLRWFVTRCNPVFDQAQILVEWFGIAIDISDVVDPFEPVTNSQEIIQIEGHLLRAARSMLDWSVEILSAKSGLSVSSIRRLEAEEESPVRAVTMVKALNCLRENGIEFCRFDNSGTYVRLRHNFSSPE